MNHKRVTLIASAFVASLSGMFVSFVLAWASSRYGPAALGSTLLAGVIPGLLITLVSGVVADKMEPRVSLAISAALRALVLVSMALGLALFDTPLIFVLGNFFLHLIGNIFADSAYIIAPALFSEDELIGINAQTELAGHAAALLGPVTAGILFVDVGMASTLVLSAILLFLSGLVMLVLPPIERPASGQTVDTQFVLAGFTRLLTERNILVVVVFFAIVNTFTASLQVALPYIAGSFGNVISYSYLLTAANIGSAIAAAMLSILKIRPTAGAIYTVGSIEGLALVGLGSARRLNLASLFLATNDAMAGISGNLFVSYLQRKIDSEFLGRVFSAMNALVMLLTPLGYLVAPILMDEMNVGTFVISLGIGTLLTSAIFGAYSYRRLMEEDF